MGRLALTPVAMNLCRGLDLSSASASPKDDDTRAFCLDGISLFLQLGVLRP